MKNLPQSQNYPQWRSMRYRLPAAYAVIALLVVLALGGVLYLTLRTYYAAQERAYLEVHAQPMVDVLATLLPTDNPESLQTQINLFSFLSRSQVEVYNPEGNIWVAGRIFQDDPMFMRGERASRGFFVSSALGEANGAFNYLLISPNDRNVVVMEDGNTIRLDVATENGSSDLAMPSQGVISGRTSATSPLIGELQTTATLRTLPANEAGMAADFVFESARNPDVRFQVVPATFGFGESQHEFNNERFSDTSTEIFEAPILAFDGTWLGTLRLSDGPSYGGIIIGGVMSGWLLASAVSVALALVLGWVASRDVVNPLTKLSSATKEMASGELSTRVQIQREDEFGSLAESFNHMAERIEDTVNTLQRFISDAAHEINTPITALRTNLELLDTSESSETLERALGQVKRLEDLTRNLLQLSRLESEVEDSSVEQIEANGLAQEVAQFYASQAEQAQIRMVISLAATPLYIEANRAQILRALSNLLHNAIKFTPADGNIEILVQGNGEQMRFTIEDTGIGIPPNDLPYLFNRFHRGRNAARYAGSGLGLAIVQAIVSRYGGKVSAENAEQGARFTVEMPVIASKTEFLTGKNQSNHLVKQGQELSQ